MFKRTILFFLVSLFAITSWGNSSFTPVKNIDVVYRLDTRSPEEIGVVGGMWPRAIEGRIKNNFLINHFSGLSVKKGTSNFVSTTVQVGELVKFFGAFEEEKAWIYMVRPASNFYNVRASLEAASDLTEDEDDKCLLKVITRLFATMKEYIAQGGFSNDRIIGYAPITKELIKNTPKDEIIKESFWEHRFEKNSAYNSLYDNDVASVQLYKDIGKPSNYVLKLKTLVQKIFKTEVPLAYSCLGVSVKQELRFGHDKCEKVEIEVVPYYENWLKMIRLEALLNDELIHSISNQGEL